MKKPAGKAVSDGRRKFNELRATVSPERRARTAAATKEMIAKLPRGGLRHAREFTQATLTEAMECGQGNRLEVLKGDRKGEHSILGASAQFWLNAQTAWDLWHQMHSPAAKEIRRIRRFNAA